MINPQFRIGHGFDLHVLADGRKLILGGIEIPFERGLLDIRMQIVFCMLCPMPFWVHVVYLILGPIFLDNDPSFKDLNSSIILKRAIEEARNLGYRCSNIDLTIIAQRPKIGPHIAKMKENISEIAGIDPSLIGIKATIMKK